MSKIKIVAVFVLVMSAINLLNCFSGIHWSSFLVSILGISGAYLVHKDRPQGLPMLKYWMFAQLIIVDPLWNAAQTFDFALGYESTGFSFKINFAAVIYYLVFRNHLYVHLLGKSIQLQPLSADSHLAKYLPNTFCIKEPVALGDDKNWLLVACTEPSDKPFALIRPKEDTALDLKGSQVIRFRFVHDIHDLRDKNNEEDFMTGGYARIIAA